MQRLLILAVLALSLLAPQAGAQVQPKAYAPENLTTLAPNDRARVIRLEYADQSDGREIPDDQLQFYMDQVGSGWSFSRIKQDIAESLTGSYASDGWQGPNVRGQRPIDDGRVFRCASRDGYPMECESGTRNRVQLHRNLSRTQCIEGQNWGQTRGMVWVTRGCRAEFIDSGSRWDEGRYGYSVTCSSPSESYRTCAWNQRYGRPELLQTLSRTQCIEGRSWGYRGSQIWVDRGCRGRFGARQRS